MSTVKNGCRIKESWTVCIPPGSRTPVKTAATEIVDFFRTEQGFTLPIVESGTAASRSNAIWIGEQKDLSEAITLPDPESYSLDIAPDRVRIVGADPRGAVYGAFAFEELIEFAGNQSLGPQSLRKSPLFSVRAGFPSIMKYGEEEMRFLARTTVNTLYLHYEPYIEQLTPSDILPADGDAIMWRQDKIDEFNEIFERAKKWGLDCYAYARGTRSIPQFSGKDEVEMRPFMPDLQKEIFAKHPDSEGSNSGIKAFRPNGGMYSNGRMDHKRDTPMCFSSPTVKAFLRETVRNLFTHMPLLDGLVVLTTDGTLWCDETCPRCRSTPLMVRWAEYVNLLLSAARSVKPAAKVIYYGWGFPTEREVRDKLLSSLDRDVIFMGDPIEGAVHRIEGELFREVRDTDSSIAVQGLGDIYLKDVETAMRTGHKVINLQTFCRNNDFSYVPYVPSPYAHINQIANTQRLKLNGWLTLDGTGLNEAVTCEIAARWGSWEPAESLPGILERIALRDFGEKAAPGVLAAWRAISTAVTKSPAGAYHLGPFLGRVAKYPLVVHDDLLLYMHEVTDMWCSVDYVHIDIGYIRKTLRLYVKCRDEFGVGVRMLEESIPLVVTEKQKAKLGHALGVALVGLNQLDSAVNFLRWVSLMRIEPGDIEGQMEIVKEETKCAKRLARILEEHRDPHFGFNPFWGRTFFARDIAKKIEVMEKSLSVHGVTV